MLDSSAFNLGGLGKGLRWRWGGGGGFIAKEIRIRVSKREQFEIDIIS